MSLILLKFNPALSASIKNSLATANWEYLKAFENNFENSASFNDE